MGHHIIVAKSSQDPDVSLLSDIAHWPGARRGGNAESTLLPVQKEQLGGDSFSTVLTSAATDTNGRGGKSILYFSCCTESWTLKAKSVCLFDSLCISNSLCKDLNFMIPDFFKFSLSSWWSWYPLFLYVSYTVFVIIYIVGLCYYLYSGSFQSDWEM